MKPSYDYVMSQSQPAPYYPPLKKSSTGTIIVVVVVVVALVAGLGAYGAYRIFQASPQQAHTTDISGNSLTETVPINSDSTVNMACNYCTITLQLSPSTVTVALDISGNYNHVTITGGQTNISVIGNYNVVNAQQTVVLSVQNTGNGNTVQR